MKLKKLYKYDKGRQIFRLIPTETNKLVIEERDRLKKEAFFSCLEIKSGKKIFQDFQFEEKFWIGIEKIYKDVIFFHKFERPDLPNHKGIIAFDIKSQTTLWENQNKFLFASDDKIVFMSNESGITKLFMVDYLNGESFTNPEEFFNLAPQNENYNSYIYSRKISQKELESFLHPDFNKKISDYLIKDYVNFAVKNDLSFYSFHYINEEGTMDNIFFAVDNNGTIVLEETLNKGLEKLEPESFFIKDDLLFLLFGMTGFGVYQIL